MEYRILGPLEVLDERTHVILRGAKQRALLAILLINAGRVVSTDQLIDALWGDEAPRTAANGLQVYVASLRKALSRNAGMGANDALVTKRPGYVLEAKPDEVDAQRFEHLAAEGARSLRSGRFEAAAETLREGLALWRGPALVDFTYEIFVRAEIERLDGLKAAALEDRIEADLALGRHAALIPELRSLTTIWPLRERLRGHQMLALYRSGRQAEALEAYREAREVLADELGIDPGPALRRLEAAILSQDPSIDEPVSLPTELVASDAATDAAAGPWPHSPVPQRTDPSAVLRSAPVEERKVVTVVFCDLVGFTADSDEEDPEDVRARIRPYHQLLRTEIERHGGMVEKFIGDAVMAVFGAPVAHEDDPDRAVRAGLRITEAIEEMNRRQPALDLHVRVGIETGTALVALGAALELGEPMVTGDVVNTASRLQGVAPVDGVVVGRGTYQATGEGFDYQELDPVTLRGKAKPVPIFQARAALSTLGAYLMDQPATPLVGRAIDLAILTGSLEKAIREATVQLVTLVGEPGAGKTRLVAELATLIQAKAEPVRWRQGRCLPYGDAITFWALGEIVKAEAGIFENDSPDAAGAKIDAVIADGRADAPWLRARLRPLVGLDAPEAAREENFVAWRTFLESLAERGPVVFVLEDLHWADDGLLAFVEHLAEYAEGVPMLVVATARPELYERVPAFAHGARNAHRINLAPLSEDEMSRLIANLVQDDVPPPGILSTILARSGGNPFYAEEYVRLMRDQGGDSKTGSHWIAEGAAVSIPSGIQGLIGARLDTLASERKALLQDAAVIGKVFWSGAVATMGGRDPEEVSEALHELCRKEFIRPARRSSMEGESEYSFFHALVRDVCYVQIPRARRAERHQHAATWIERISQDRVEDYAEILAAHYATALVLATAAKDPSTDGLSVKALRYLTLAGDRALGIDVEAAERHYARALALTTEGELGKPEILARHGEALRLRARYPEAAEDYREAIEGFWAKGDLRGMGMAMGRYALVLRWLGDSTYRSVAAEALAAIEPLGPSPELVTALTGQAWASLVSEEHHETIAFAEQAIALASELGLPEPARALGFRGGARVALGDAGGLHDMRHALEAAAAQGMGRDVAQLHYNLAAALWAIEGPRAQLELVREGAAYAARRGIEEFVLALDAPTVAMLVDLGDYDGALAVARDIVPRLEDAAHLNDLLGVHLAQGRVLCRRGEYAEAAPLVELALKRARDHAPEYLAAVLPVAAALQLGLGDAPRALALLAELEGFPNLRAAPYYPPNLPGVLRTALAAGDPNLGRRLAKGLAPTYSLHEHALTTARALLAEQRGSQSEAAELFADAAERWDRFEMPWERAQALLGQGRCLLALGKASEATKALSVAKEIFASLDATPAIDETDTSLGAAESMS